MAGKKKYRALSTSSPSKKSNLPAFQSGDEIELAADEAKVLLKCGAVMEIGKPPAKVAPKPKDSEKDDDKDKDK